LKKSISELFFTDSAYTTRTQIPQKVHFLRNLVFRV